MIIIINIHYSYLFNEKLFIFNNEKFKRSLNVKFNIFNQCIKKLFFFNFFKIQINKLILKLYIRKLFCRLENLIISY